MPRRAGAVHVDDALVFRAAKAQAEVALRVHIAPVNEDVDEREHLVGHLAARVRAVDGELLVEHEARKRPDVLIRIALAHPVQKRHERALILRLERVAAEQRQAADKGLFQLVEDDLLGRRVKGLTVMKVPRLRLEAVVAVIRAAGDEQRHAHADAVGDVAGLDLTVIHSNSSQTAGAPLQTRPPGIFFSARRLTGAAHAP